MEETLMCFQLFVFVCLSDSQVGVLRVWNVSRSTPLDSFKLKKTGFHALHVFNSPLAKKGKTKMIYTTSTSPECVCGMCMCVSASRT